MRKPFVVASMALAAFAAASPLAAQSPIGSPCSSATNSQIYYGGSGIPTDLSYCGMAAGAGNVIALTAHGRYASPTPTTSGNGEFYAMPGESVGAPNNAGFASWNFAYFAGNISGLSNPYTYVVSVDRDPSAGVSFIPWAVFGGDGHDSSNQGFVPGFDPFAVGTYAVRLDQYNLNGGLEGSVAINVNVGITATPEPASWAMMATGLFVVGGVVRRRNKRGATV